MSNETQQTSKKKPTHVYVTLGVQTVSLLIGILLDDPYSFVRDAGLITSAIYFGREVAYFQGTMGRSERYRVKYPELVGLAWWKGLLPWYWVKIEKGAWGDFWQPALTAIVYTFAVHLVTIKLAL